MCATQVWWLHQQLPSYPYKGAALMAHAQHLQQQGEAGECEAGAVWPAFQATVQAYRWAFSQKSLAAGHFTFSIWHAAVNNQYDVKSEPLQPMV